MTPPPSQNARILVIEDDPSVGVLLQRTLSRAGHAVTLATTGAAGRKEIAAGLFELLIMDRNLPDVDGLRLLKDLQSNHPSVRAIVITGDPTPPTRLAAWGLGAFGYLSKPFEVGTLLSLCAGALNPAVPLSPASSRVLVVDDDDSVARLFSQVLKRGGFEVQLASSMETAVALLDLHHFDLLLVDRCLLGGDGVELAQLARQKLPDLAVILMTAGVPPTLAQRAKVDGYLPKPFRDLRTLIGEIRRVLETRARKTLPA